jgi:hypothetical protein
MIASATGSEPGKFNPAKIQRRKMQPHQERVIVEHNDLHKKLNKLKHFIMESPIFKTLPRDEQGRLNRQYGAMLEYFNILGERITAFGFEPRTGAVGGFSDKNS